LRLTINRAEPMWIQAGAAGTYGLIASMKYRIMEDEQNGPYRCSTLSYIYDIVRECPTDPAGEELLAFHWHPDNPQTTDEPHLHLRGGLGRLSSGFTKLHIPTGRVTLEDMMIFLVSELGAEPRAGTEQALEVLHDVRRSHVLHRSWHARPTSALKASIAAVVGAAAMVTRRGRK
jgi:hypothetical protein